MKQKSLQKKMKQKLLQKKMKQKLLDIFDFIVFIVFFIMLLPFLIITGAIARPVRFVKYVSAKVNNKKVKEYFF